MSIGSHADTPSFSFSVHVFLWKSLNLLISVAFTIAQSKDIFKYIPETHFYSSALIISPWCGSAGIMRMMTGSIIHIYPNSTSEISITQKPTSSA